MELEAKLANVDRIVKENNDRRNELETYVYEMRGKMDGTHKDFMSEPEKEAFLNKLDDVQQWLYDEGEHANKTAYAEKMQELKKIGDPMLSRYWESEQRPHRLATLKKLVNSYQQFADSTEEKYAHIGKEDRDAVRKAATEADEWMLNKMVQQDKIAHYEQPSMMCSEIDSKYRELLNTCQPVITKPKPEPPKPEPPKVEPQPEVKKEEQKDNVENKTKEVESQNEKEKGSNDNKENQQQTSSTTTPTVNGTAENIGNEKPGNQEKGTEDKAIEADPKN